MVLWESPRQCGSWTLCEGFCWLLLLPVTLLIIARPVKLAAFPTSLSDCQTPTGWNCSGKSRPSLSSPLLHPSEARNLYRQTCLPTRVRLPSPTPSTARNPGLPTSIHPEKHWEKLQPERVGPCWDRNKVQVSGNRGCLPSNWS